MRMLSSMPVFGYETRGCHCDNYDHKSKENTSTYRGVNAVKVAGCIPVLGGIPAGIIWIEAGVAALKGEFSAKKLGNTEHPNLKGAALITRGIITMLGGGIVFALADVATTIGRAAKAQLFSNQ